MFYFFPFHLLFTPHSLKSGLCFHQSTAHILTGTRDSVRAEGAMPRNWPVQNLAHHQNLSTEFIKSICAYRLCLLSQKLSQAGPGNLLPPIPFSLGTSLTALPSPQGSSQEGLCHHDATPTIAFCSLLSHWPNLSPFSFLISSGHPTGISSDLS